MKIEWIISWKKNPARIFFTFVSNPIFMRKQQILFTIIIFLFFGNFAKAQTIKKDSLQTQTIVADTNQSIIIKDARIDALIQKQIAINEKTKGKFLGYRIQIHFGIDKTKALDMKATFIGKFPNYSSYLIYEQPYFKIRVGDFRTRLEAYNFLQQIQTIFPAAFLVRDQIELPKLPK